MSTEFSQMLSFFFSCSPVRNNNATTTRVQSNPITLNVPRNVPCDANIIRTWQMEFLSQYDGRHVTADLNFITVLITCLPLMLNVN